MSRRRLGIVIVTIAFASLANPLLAGWNDSRFALFGAEAPEPTCVTATTAEADDA